MDKYYNTAILKVFDDDLKTNLSWVQTMFQKLRDTFENASLEDDVWQEFKIEEEFLELDTEL